MEPKVGQILCWEELIDGIKGIKGSFIINSPGKDFNFNFIAKSVGSGRHEYEGTITTPHVELAIKPKEQVVVPKQEIQKYSFDDLDI